MKSHKILIFSDIHSNIYALKRFIKITEKINYDLAIFLGDIFGYYYHPYESYELMKSTFKNLHILRGNHDLYFLRAINKPAIIKDLTKRFGSGYSHYYENNNRIIVKELKKTKPCRYFPKYNLLAVHGSYKDFQEGRVYPDTEIKPKDIIKIKDNFKGIRIFLSGHTHYPMFKRQNGIIFLNPGSIGQPRDNNNPSFIVLEVDKALTNVCFGSFDYKKDNLIKLTKLKDPDHKYLTEVLGR